MKINEHQLTQHINRQLLPLYWVAGDEPYLLEKTLKSLHTVANQKGYSERHRVHVDNAIFDPEELFMHCNAMSLFAEQKCIEIVISHKIPEGLTKALITLFENPPEATIIFIHSAKLTPAQQKSKWFTTLDRIMGFVPIWPVDTQKLPSWLQQEAKERGLSLDQDACYYLAECTEGNLLAAAQALDKLAYTADNKQINLSTLKQNVEDQARFDVYALVSCFLQNNISKALHILNHLKAENTEPTVIIWALSKEFRLLVQLHQTLKTVALPQAFKQFNIWPKRQPEIQKALHRFNTQQCLQLLQHMASLDKITKGIVIGEPWFALQQMITQGLFK